MTILGLPQTSKKLVNHFKWGPGQSEIWRADTSKKRWILACAGEQGGKTILGAYWLKREWKKNYGKGFNYIVLCPTYKILSQSTLPTFQKAFRNIPGSYNGKEDAYRLPDGGHIFFRSATDPDSVVGVPNCAAGWIDEAGKCSRPSFFSVVGRVARLQGAIILTTTPYALNYVKREIIDPFERQQRQDILYVRWRSIDNPTYPQAEYDRLREILPPRLFKMRLEGLHEKAEGMIHESWDDLNWIDPFTIPKTWVKVGGVDWGYDHPLALTVRAINPDGYCFGISYFKQSGLTSEQQLDLIEARHKLLGVRIWGCGHDRPEQIEALKRRGVPAMRYCEGQEDYKEIRAGDSKLSGLIHRKRYRVFKGVEYADDLEDEYQTYVWDKNDADDDKKREKPINDGHGHDFMAAERYCTVVSIPYLTEKKEEFRIPLNVNLVYDTFDPKKFSRTKKHWAQD